MAVSLEIALVEPEIPQNTGNIARTCVAVGARLHLVEPLGFSIDNRHLKRAGLDYWFDLDLTLWPDIDTLLRGQENGKKIYYATTKGGRVYTEADYGGDILLVFGKETKGLPESLLMAHPERCLRIPMLAGRRSLNLSNAVAVMAYETLRQQGFPEMLQASLYFNNPNEVIG
ncbi:MAG TPA: tRNA (uridine(34)/cytosine(34)/5-carboxymethylaminomethyluridine(34)-2'-O)-methyltransferase TrmL [Clostridiales bacterium]|nr:tRNA (uridine(34)/cytosine(34)/5-carboxymethylaminomethyluridine(34)-2'-O)-methyltransferase TrmL [Clostridiales bacterium]